MTAPDPAKVVCEAGTFECKDSGKRPLTGVAGGGIKLTVSGKPVLPVANAGGSGTYVGCPISDNSGPKPCNSTSVSTAGAARLTVGGNHVLLGSDAITAANPINGTAPATIHPGQTLLTAT